MGCKVQSASCKARSAAVVVRRTTYFHASSTPPHAPSQLSSHTPSAPPRPPGLSLPLSLAPTHCSAATLLCYTPTPSSIPHHDATATATACLPRPLPPRPMSCLSLLPQSNPELPLAPSPYIASTLPRPSSAPVPFGSAIPRGVPCLVDILLPSSFDTDLEGRPDRRDSSLNNFTSPAVLQVQSPSCQVKSIRSDPVWPHIVICSPASNVGIPSSYQCLNLHHIIASFLPSCYYQSRWLCYWWYWAPRLSVIQIRHPNRRLSLNNCFVWSTFFL